MVADTDNRGQNEDEYLPEVTGEEHVVGEEYSPEGDSPLRSMEPEAQEMAPQRTSVTRKIMTALGITIVAIAVSMYLTHKQKAKEAAQMAVTPPSKMVSINPSETPTPAENKAPLKAELSKTDVSKNTSTTTPSNTVSPFAEMISKNVSATTETTAKTASSTAEKASKTVSAAAETATKTENAPAEKEPKTVIATAEKEPKTASAEIAPKTVSAAAETTAKTANAPAEIAPKTESAPAEKESKMMNVAAAETPAKLVSAPAEISAPTAPAESPKIISQIEDLTAKTQGNQTKIGDLSTRLDSINNAITVLNKTVSSMEKKLSAPIIVTQPTTRPMITAMPAGIRHHHHKGNHRQHQRRRADQDRVRQTDEQKARRVKHRIAQRHQHLAAKERNEIAVDRAQHEHQLVLEFGIGHRQIIRPLRFDAALLQQQIKNIDRNQCQPGEKSEP